MGPSRALQCALSSLLSKPARLRPACGAGGATGIERGQWRNIKEMGDRPSKAAEGGVEEPGVLEAGLPYQVGLYTAAPRVMESVCVLWGWAGLAELEGCFSAH